MLKTMRVTTKIAKTRQKLAQERARIRFIKRAEYRRTALKLILLVTMLWAIKDQSIAIYHNFNDKIEFNITNPTLVSSKVENAEVEASTPSDRGSQTPLAGDIEEMIAKTFPECPDTMLAIAMAESSMRHDAVNINKNGSKDCGLMQINSIHGYDCEWLKDPKNNLEVARKVYEKQGLKAWSSYNFAKRNNLPI